MDWEVRCRELQKRVEELENENRDLHHRLGLTEPTTHEKADLQSVCEIPVVTTFPAVHMRSTPEEKIRLFRSLFRGREDVYARRWYSVQKEKSGYAPVCANEWRYGVCLKPKGKYSKCENRELVPLDNAAIYKHLSGKDANGGDVIGLYPILPDDTCCFLAIDFDDGAWRENVAAVRSVCAEWNIPCGVERSRSGEGAHLWIFFEEAIPCVTARKLGSALLTAAMEQEGKLRLDSYDRMFPNQDTLPNGGFGNLIALPLQGQARKKGNSEFVDEAFRPYQDQWAYLSEIKRLNTETVEALIKTHSRGDALGDLCVTEPISKPWEKKRQSSLTAMDCHGVQRIVRSNMLYIPVDGFSSRARNQIIRLAAFRNPDFYKSQAMRLPIYDKPRIICTAEEREGYDYVDIHVPMLDKMYQKRLKGYAAIGYRIKTDGTPQTNPDLIYDGKSFYPVFCEDIRNAKSEILIVSPFMRKSRITQMLRILSEAMLNKAKVVVVTRPAEDFPEKDRDAVLENTERLKSYGVEVQHKSGFHQKFTVIDGQTVWYGSVNFLSFGTAEESIMRFTSHDIAGQLMDTVL